MADTGSFPIALQVPPATGRPSWTSGDRHDLAWRLGGAAFAMFLLGAGSAAAGFQLEAQGYGSLVLVGGALIGIATAVPAWLLFRAPPTARK
jgi:hypothetical protein